MRIVHLLHEFPDPPTSGIRCDMMRRLDAFLALGHSVFAVAWLPAAPGDRPAQARIDALSARLSGLALHVIGSDLAARARRVWNLRQHPSYVAARMLRPGDVDALVARLSTFAPDLIWLEGVHPSWLALTLRERLGVPLAYRSHNIEHRYLAEQAMLAPTARQKLALGAGTWGLEAAERRLHATANHVYDISADDLAFWRGQGMTNNSWLAPQPDPAVLATIGAPDASRDIDLLFVGSLSSPNNIAGLTWYLDRVHPALVERVGPVRVRVAGRRPPAALAQRITSAGIELEADPPAVAPLFARARVTMNPILHGSGVNIKTVDMLASGRPVVTTAKGARGLPAEVVDQLDLADTPGEFAARAAARIADARQGASSTDRRALIDRVFGQAAVAEALARLPATREAA